MFLERGYLKEGITPEERYRKIAYTIERISKIEGIEKRFLRYIENNWISFATPVLANFGEIDNLPISCNHGTIKDNLNSILGEVHKVGMMAKYGAGTAKNFSNIRPLGSKISRGGNSESIISWIDFYASMIGKVSQGSTRRGFFTAYLSVGHAEIEEFLKIGGKDSAIQNITTAVTIPKGWMQELKAGNKAHRKIWAQISKSRQEKGYPYILFEENCNINQPQVYADKGVWLDNANICIEAIEYCDDKKEFACCLSSVNALKYDDWKDDPNFLFDNYIMLDCVITEYLDKGSKLPGLEKAIRFAEEHRAIGLGILGFHSYLQSKMIAFGSMDCFRFNNEIFKKLREEGERATKWMAEQWGAPAYLKGYVRRNTSLMAQAPTKSTAFIMGNLSEGIEPIKSNYNEKLLAKGQFEYKNPQLLQLLESKGLNTKEVWRDILVNNGSVQHVDYLNPSEKEVFKTFSEISQKDIISLSAQRQKHIDMGQSINLMIHPDTPAKDINNLLLDAYDMGVKSLYYQYSMSATQQFNKDLMNCSACEA